MWNVMTSKDEGMYVADPFLHPDTQMGREPPHLIPN